jgi:hypothetical protein
MAKCLVEISIFKLLCHTCARGATGWPEQWVSTVRGRGAPRESLVSGFRRPALAKVVQELYEAPKQQWPEGALALKKYLGQLPLKANQN